MNKEELRTYPQGTTVWALPYNGDTNPARITEGKIVMRERSQRGGVVVEHESGQRLTVAPKEVYTSKEEAIAAREQQFDKAIELIHQQIKWLQEERTKQFEIY